MNKRIFAIIQARMGSTRLPGKVLKPILGKPMLWHVVNRVKHAKKVDNVVVATSTNKMDQKIVQFCQRFNIKFFCGSEKDVLERFYIGAKKNRADIIVRITADCPLIDPDTIDKTINLFQNGNYDYASVATGAGAAKDKINKFPDGLDCEVIAFKTLERAFKEAGETLEREHVTMYIWKNPKKFKLERLYSKKDYSLLRFTVDQPSDLKFVRTIYKNLYPKKDNFSLNDIISFIYNNHQVLKINQQNIGKEGYENLWQEFKNHTVSQNSLRNISSVVVFSAEETDISGENEERIKAGIESARKLPNSILTFLGTKKHNQEFKKYIAKIKYTGDIATPTNKINANTKTQIKDLVSFVKKKALDNLLIISHSYHIPRIKRYFKKYLQGKKLFFYSVGNIENQRNKISEEIQKIIAYSKKGDLII